MVRQPALVRASASEGTGRLDKLVFGGLCLWVALGPVVMAPWLRDGRWLPKALLLLVVTAFVGLVSLVGGQAESGPPTKTNAAGLLVLVFLALAALSTVGSVHLWTSFLGSYGRYQGLITFLSYGTLYLVVSRLRWTQGSVDTLLSCLAWSSALLAGVALLQAGGYNTWNFVGAERRAWASFGNAALLGGYFTLTLPLSLALAVTRKETWRWVAYLALTILILAGLVATQTRAAFLATVISLALFLALAKMRLGSRRWLALLGVFLVVATAVVVTLSGQGKFTGQLTGAALSRSATARLQIWQSVWQAIRDRPVLGSGPDTLGLVYPAYASRKFLAIEGRNAYLDNAHNLPLQLAGTLGLPAVAVFLALWLLLAYRAYTGYRHGADDTTSLISAALFVSLIGYLVVSLSNVTSLVADAWLWIVFGLVIALSGRQGKQLIGQNLILIVLGATLLVGAMLTGRAVLADLHFRRGITAGQNGQLALAQAEYELAIKLNWLPGDYAAALAYTHVQLGGVYRSERHFDMAAQVLKQAEARNSLEIQNYRSEAETYYNAAQITGKKHYFGQLKMATDHLLSLLPNSAHAHYLIANANIDQGNYRLAETHLKVAVAIDPNWASAWAALGFTQAKRGRTEAAMAAYRRALRLKPGWQPAEAELRKLQKP